MHPVLKNCNQLHGADGNVVSRLPIVPKRYKTSLYRLCEVIVDLTRFILTQPAQDCLKN